MVHPGFSSWTSIFQTEQDFKEFTRSQQSISLDGGKWLHSPGLDTNLLDRRTATKFSFPSGVRIPRQVDPRLTGTHDEHTIARNMQMASHSEDSSRWMASLRLWLFLLGIGQLEILKQTQSPVAGSPWASMDPTFWVVRSERHILQGLFQTCLQARSTRPASLFKSIGDLFRFPIRFPRRSP